MISEADAALAALLRRELLDASRVQVVFDAPTKEWAAKRNGPAVNLFLYDIREDTRRRSSGLVPRFGDDGRVVARQTPPRIFRLFYLLSVWGQRAEDEHRLLGQLLDTLLVHDLVPPDLLPDAPSPVGLSVGLPPEDDRSFADVWSALGGELRPSIDVVLSLPIEAGRSKDAGPAIAEPLQVALSDMDAATQENGSPENAAHENAAHENASRENRSLQNMTLENGSQENEFPENGSPENGSPESGSPEKGALENGRRRGGRKRTDRG